MAFGQALTASSHGVVGRRSHQAIVSGHAGRFTKVTALCPVYGRRSRDDGASSRDLRWDALGGRLGPAAGARYLVVAVRAVVAVGGMPLVAATDSVPVNVPTVFGATNRTTTLQDPLIAMVVPQVVLSRV